MDQDLTYECPHPDCDRAFDEEYKLDQHLDSTGHGDWDGGDDDCHCGSCGDCDAPGDEDTMQVEHHHTINVVHLQRKEVHLLPPRKNSDRVVSLAGECLNDPESCSLKDLKSISASVLSVSQGHDDPVYKSGGTYIEEEYVDENYDSDDESEFDIHGLCECGNQSATNCSNNSCRRCCVGCRIH